MSFTSKSSLLSILPLTVLAACGGGGGGGTPTSAPPQPVGNLRVVDMRVLSAEPNAAHEVMIEIAVQSTAEIPNVNVDYYALLREDVDGGVEEPRQHLIGSSRFETLPIGDSAQRATFVIPDTIEPAGSYYVVAQMDPLDEIFETDETDNLPGAGAPDTLIEIRRDRLAAADLVLESLTPDAEVVVLGDDEVLYQIGTTVDVPNHAFGATLEMSTSGRDVVSNVDITARLDVDGTSHDLEIWHREQSEFRTRFDLDEVTPGIPNTIHLDFRIPNALRTELLDRLEMTGADSATLQVRTNDFAGIDEWEPGSSRFSDREDNVIEATVRFVASVDGSTNGAIVFEEDFEKTWSNGVFGVAVDLEGTASIDTRGAIASVDAAVPVMLFGERFELFELEAYGQSTPQDTTKSRFQLEVRSLGETLFSEVETSPTYLYENEWSVRRTKEAQSLVWVGPVPVQLTAGASGTIGYSTNLRLSTSELDLATGPFAEADAYAQAEIQLGVASGGVRGDITLIREELTANVSADFELIDGGTRLRGPVAMELTNELTGPNGRIYLFVNYPGVKLCKTILGSVPCGVTTHRKEKTLVKFKPFTKTDSLFANTQFADVTL